MLDDTQLGRELPDPAAIDLCDGPAGHHIASDAARACAEDGLINETRCLVCSRRLYFHHGTDPVWQMWSTVPLTAKLWFE